MGLPHFRRVFRHAFTANKTDDTEELLSYRTAVWGLIVSLITCDRLVLRGRTEFRVCGIRDTGLYMHCCGCDGTQYSGRWFANDEETSFRPLDLYQLVASKASLGAQSLTVLSFLDAIFTPRSARVNSDRVLRRLKN